MIVDGLRHYGDILVALNSYSDFLDLCGRHSISGRYVIDSHSISISSYKNPLLIVSTETKNTVIGAFRLRYPGHKIVIINS